MSDFKAADSPRCSYCLGALQNCYCNNINYLGSMLRYEVIVKAGIIPDIKLKNKTYIFGGEL